MFLISDLCNMHFRSYEVDRDHQQHLSNKFWLGWTTGFKPPLMSLPCSVKSLICIITLSSQLMTLTWVQLSKLNGLGQILYHSMPLEEKNVCVRFFFYLSWANKYLRDNDFKPFWPLCSFCPVEANWLTWGQIWRLIMDVNVNGLPFAFSALL